MTHARRRGWWITLAAVVATILGVVSAAVMGNSFRIIQAEHSIPGPEGQLEAILASPPDREAIGLVVMVHGDGPVDATNGGFYLPWFEAAADAGFATLSWSKPGVGASDGDWLAQSMADRAAEVSAALDWAREQGIAAGGPVVLWGASQAGWVVPAVAAERDDIGAVVGLGVAINWERQGRFDLLADLEDDGADSAEWERAVAVSDQTLDLLQQGADYATYRAHTLDAEPMSEGRWGFALANFRSDASADLEAMAPRHLPVLLLLGDQDRNVDVAETERVYAELLGDSVHIVRYDGAHSSARTVMEKNELVGAATAIVWPRALFADGVLAAYRDFLAEVG